MLENYTTIATAIEGELVEKKSKFIANLISVASEEEALQRLEEIRKKHREAKHHVFVYRLADGTERASDDGEPSGTAGAPILDLLRGANLQNILVVVTRYFGGILLGTGGLVRAYRDVVKQTLQQGTTVVKVLYVICHLKLPYSYYDKLLHFCQHHQVSILQSDFQEEVEISLGMKHAYEEELLAQLEEITDRTAKIEDNREKIYR